MDKPLKALLEAHATAAAKAAAETDPATKKKFEDQAKTAETAAIKMAGLIT